MLFVQDDKRKKEMLGATVLGLGDLLGSENLISQSSINTVFVEKKWISWETVKKVSELVDRRRDDALNAASEAIRN